MSKFIKVSQDNKSRFINLDDVAELQIESPNAHTNGSYTKISFRMKGSNLWETDCSIYEPKGEYLENMMTRSEMPAQPGFSLICIDTIMWAGHYRLRKAPIIGWYVSPEQEHLPVPITAANSKGFSILNAFKAIQYPDGRVCEKMSGTAYPTVDAW